MQLSLISSLYLVLIIGIVPGLFATLYVIYKYKTAARVAVYGALGWLLAVILRTPILQIFAGYVVENPQLVFIQIILGASLAGIFEEGLRYFLITKSKSFWKPKEGIISYGLGWGVGEAILIFGTAMVANIIWLPVLYPVESSQFVSFINVVPGAYERLITICAHLSLTIIVALGVFERKYVGIAILWHIIYDLAAGFSVIYLLPDVWLIEALLTMFSVFIGVHALGKWKTLKKNLVQSSDNNPPLQIFAQDESLSTEPQNGEM